MSRWEPIEGNCLDALQRGDGRMTPKPLDPAELDTVRRLCGQIETEPYDDDGHVCTRCSATMQVEFGDEPTPLCHGCAQEGIEWMPGMLASIDAARAEAVREIVGRLRAEFSMNRNTMQLADYIESEFAPPKGEGGGE